MKQALVIGGGLGGLSAAIRLADQGMNVTLLEAQSALGGKLQRRVLGGYRFDRGPSTITMPWVFEQQFRDAGERFEDYVTFQRLDPAARNRFPDGSIVDLSGDVGSMQQQIASYSRDDAAALPAFLAETRRLYLISEERFLTKLPYRIKDRLNLSMLRSLLAIRPLRSVESLLSRYFRHPNTLAMFGRYATYVGSSPTHAPAVFSMMAHLEQSLGIYGVQGGTYEIASAMERLARRKGVQIRTDTPVRKIEVRGSRAVGARTDDDFYPADVIVANADALTAYQWIEGFHRPSFPDRKINRLEPSLSGFVLLLGVRKRFDRLLHHNVWFPESYGEEFREIFRLGTAPVDPAIYVCWSGYSDPYAAPPGGSNLFVLVNAPPLGKEWEWKREAPSYIERILDRMEARLGPFRHLIEAQEYYDPEMLAEDTGAHRGAIYGISSNRPSQAFLRPANRSKDIPNLWFAGGTTHPGGGTPVVTLSGRMVADEIIKCYR